MFEIKGSVDIKQLFLKKNFCILLFFFFFFLLSDFLSGSL